MLPDPPGLLMAPTLGLTLGRGPALSQKESAPDVVSVRCWVARPLASVWNISKGPACPGDPWGLAEACALSFCRPVPSMSCFLANNTKPTETNLQAAKSYVG